MPPYPLTGFVLFLLLAASITYYCLVAPSSTSPSFSTYDDHDTPLPSRVSAALADAERDMVEDDPRLPSLHAERVRYEDHPHYRPYRRPVL